MLLLLVVGHDGLGGSEQSLKHRLPPLLPYLVLSFLPGSEMSTTSPLINCCHPVTSHGSNLTQPGISVFFDHPGHVLPFSTFWVSSPISVS